MPAPGLSFRCGEATITLAEAGEVVSVVHRQRPDNYLQGGLPYVRVAGAAIRLGEPRLVADVDEVELCWTGGDVEIEVRHSFTAGWGVRVVLSNPADHTVEVEDAGLTWAPAVGAPAWALAAGATGTYAIYPAEADGPLLGGSLRVGTFESLIADGMAFGPITLAAGGRFVVQWQWDWYASPRAFGAPGGAVGSRSPSVPSRLFLAGDETARLAVDEDAALVLPTGLGSEVANGFTEILSWAGPAAYPVEVVSARGVTHYDLHWSEPLEDVVREAAELALTGRAGANGVPVLADADAALAVQQALRARVLSEPYVAEDAVEAYVARAAELGTPDPVLISLLCGEAERTGDVDLVELATSLFTAHQQAHRGLGLAATQLCVSRVLRGLDVAVVLDHLVALAGSAPATDLTSRAARLELQLVTSGGDAVQLAELSRLGRWRGAGLTGVGVAPVAVETVAQLAAVFGLATPASSAVVSRGWPAGISELGRRAEAEVLFRIAARPPGPALSTLLMATQTR